MVYVIACCEKQSVVFFNNVFIAILLKFIWQFIDTYILDTSFCRSWIFITTKWHWYNLNVLYLQQSFSFGLGSLISFAVCHYGVVSTLMSLFWIGVWFLGCKPRSCLQLFFASAQLSTAVSGWMALLKLKWFTSTSGHLDSWAR